MRLRDGGLLRGTIAEFVVGDHVTIVLITGETRRVAAADVGFAGPAGELPNDNRVAPATSVADDNRDAIATPGATATPGAEAIPMVPAAPPDSPWRPAA